MNNLFLLNILDLFKGIYIKFGINYDLMRLILKTRLIIDDRKDNGKNKFMTSLIIYLVIGLFSSVIIRLNISTFEKMTIYFSFYMILILNSFIVDFSSIILDIKDKEILKPLGIDERTLNISKLTHILMYISYISMSINIFPFIVTLRYGISYSVLFVVNIFLINIFMILITSIIYLIILKLFKGERLKDVLNNFQMMFVATIMILSQIIAMSSDLSNLQMDLGIISILYPPMWFASNFIRFEGVNLGNAVILLNVLSILIPIISFVIYIKLASVFEENLMKLSDNSYKGKFIRYSLNDVFSKLICFNKEEKIFFKFIINMIKTNRELKSRIYPSIIMSCILPFIIIYSIYEIGNYNNDYLYLSIYMSMIIVISVINMIKYSSEYEASWIYDIIPVYNKNNMYKAMIKSSIYKFVLPIYIVINIGFILLFKDMIIKQSIISLMSIILGCILIFRFSTKENPFSKAFDVMSNSSNIKEMILSIVIIIMLGINHMCVIYLKQEIIYIMVLVIITIMIYKNTFRDKC